MISQEDARARVAKGAAYLDKHWPGWAEVIDPASLEMDDCCGCIIGQLTGDYNEHVDEMLGGSPKAEPQKLSLISRLFGKVPAPQPPRIESWRVAIEYGFDVPESPMMKMRAVEFIRLQDAWIDAIAARLHPVVESTEASVTMTTRP